jgi:hypothetical protein
VNTALFTTVFWHVTWGTDQQRKLFTSLDDRKGVEVLLASIAKTRKLVAHQATAQDGRVDVLFETRDTDDSAIAESLFFVKQAVEAAILAKRPELGRVWAPTNSFERAELEPQGPCLIGWAVVEQAKAR